MTIKTLVETSELKTAFLSKVVRTGLKLFLNYDRELDILMLLAVPPSEETVVHYLCGNVGVLYRPDDLEIVGLQIEGGENGPSEVFAVGQTVVQHFDAYHKKVKILNVLNENNPSNAYNEPIYYVEYSDGSKDWVGENSLRPYKE